jgi:hypothetical protein
MSAPEITISVRHHGNVYGVLTKHTMTALISKRGLSCRFMSGRSIANPAPGKGLNANHKLIYSANQAKTINKLPINDVKPGHSLSKTGRLT